MKTKIFFNYWRFKKLYSFIKIYIHSHTTITGAYQAVQNKFHQSTLFHSIFTQIIITTYLCKISSSKISVCPFIILKYDINPAPKFSSSKYEKTPKLFKNQWPNDCCTMAFVKSTKIFPNRATNDRQKCEHAEPMALQRPRNPLPERSLASSKGKKVFKGGSKVLNVCTY